MKQFTIRGVPEEVEKQVRKEAEAKGISFNKAFVDLVQKNASTESTGPRKKKRLPRELENLFGVWSKKEADEFDKSLAVQRKIDEELWRNAG
jgi:uncharacterized secreted protein with C-terminal beta-propeller domain